MRPFGHKLEQAVRELLKNKRKKMKIKAPIQALTPPALSIKGAILISLSFSLKYKVLKEGMPS
jgi:hypothetical protein